jgi:hypothetical protein
MTLESLGAYENPQHDDTENISIPEKIEPIDDVIKQLQNKIDTSTSKSEVATLKALLDQHTKMKKNSDNEQR